MMIRGMTMTKRKNVMTEVILPLVILIFLNHFVVMLDGSWTRELSWTPIYVDTTNRADLWTIRTTGCECPGSSRSYTCACCVPGGCLCTHSHNKCTQCGLEEVCQRFCNVTISSRNIGSRSGLSWVEIRSPELDQGPTSCWWRLASAPGQRIEVQIHRLLSVGSFDNVTQSCSGGFLQFSDGDIIQSSPQATQLCSQNARYSPPIVLFGDQGTATLLLSTTMVSSRSTIVAYVSFSSVDDPYVGNPIRGGKLHQHSVCDWTFDNCWNVDQCVLASPGFPGIYPPHSRCRYILNANQTTDSIRIHFNWLSLPPPPLCSNHHVAIWKRNVSNLANLDVPWRTLCRESEISVDVDGGWALLEFRSGAIVPPYLYNGFRANVQFIQSGRRRLPPSSSSSDFNGGGRGGSVYPTDSITLINQQFPTRPSSVLMKNGNGHEGGGSRTRNSGRMSGNNNKNSNKGLQIPLYTAPSPPPLLVVPQHPSFFNPPNYDEDNEDDNTEEPLGYPRASFEAAAAGIFPITCGHVFDGLTTRGSVFRMILPKDMSPHLQLQQQTRGLSNVQGFGSYLMPQHQKPNPARLFKCSLEFRGKPTDVVQVAVFNYKYRGHGCSSYTEVFDLGEEPYNNHTNRMDHRPLEKLCGPSGNEVKRFTSSHNRLVLLTTVSPYDDPLNSEFLEGAFRFHDESIEGTVKPLSSCEVVYYGVTSSSSGSVSGPPDSPLLRLSTFPLVCAHSFFPGGNQTVSLTLHRAGHETAGVALPGSKKYCRTFCGNSGCKCEAKYTPLEEIDHLLLIAGSNPIGCLCGYFPDVLPMTFESQSPLTLVYHATKGGREFSYSASFQFRNKLPCSNFSIAPPSGSKRWREILSAETIAFNSREFHHYSFYECSWPVSTPPRYNLSIEFVSEENEKDCNTWNLTIWARTEKLHMLSHLSDQPFDLISSFCPRHRRTKVEIPENVHQAYIRLSGVTLRPPQFELRWKYVDIILPGLSERKVAAGSERITFPRLTCVFLPSTVILIYTYLLHQKFY